ncbi:S9 family peptidase [Candidatus Poribacteria bacterium]|nr:S9 family peptidase [Candidatus Poribacteria bacterium]
MAKKKTVRIDHLFQVKTFRGLRVSPDGSKAVIAVAESNLEKQRTDTSLWLWRQEDDSVERLTKGPADQLASWLDSGTIVFAARERDEDESAKDKPFPRTRLYTMSLRGGEPVRRCVLDGAVWALAPSPDGRRIALSYSPNPKHKDPDVRVWEKAPRPFVANHGMYKLDGTGDLPEELPSIWLLKTKDDEWSKPARLTKGELYWDGEPRWLPDASGVVFPRHNPAVQYTETFVYLADLKGRERQLPVPIGPVAALAVSPDGKRLAVCGNGDPERGHSMPYSIGVCSLAEEERDFRPVRESDGRHGLMDITGDVNQGMPETLCWADEATIHSLHGVHGHCELIEINADNGKDRVLAGKSGVVSGFSTRGGSTLFVHGDPRQPGEVFRLGRDKPLTRFNNAVAKVFDVRPKRWYVETEPGVRVDTYLWATDKQLRAGKPRTLPLVLQIHGGPAAQAGDNVFHEYTWMAHEGYPVLICNPRGSTGYGAEHGTGIAGRWGDRDVHDILSVLRETLAKYPQFDPARVFCVGGSYGGYMTNMLLSRHPGVFRAGVTQRCVSNYLSMSGQSDLTNKLCPEAMGTRSIFDDPLRAWEQSPLSRARGLREPLLIIHSDNDQRCPLGQGEELFAALVENGRRINEEVRLVIFKGESHGLSRGGKPANRRRRLEEILGWIRKHDSA